MDKKDRSDYKSKNGIASWWQKDGSWHIALAEKDLQGWDTGHFLWTADQYYSKDEAIAAIQADNR